MSRLAIQSVFSTLFIIAVSLPAWGQGGGCESEREEIRARYYSLSNQCMKLINDKDKKIDDKNKELSLSKMAIPRIDLSSSDTSGDYGSPIRMSAKIYNSSDHIIKIDASRTCLHVPSKLLVGNGDPAKKCIPPDNLESRIEIQPNSEFTLTWETTQSKYISGNIIEVLIGGFTFKPELYVFTVNIDMHHEVNGSTAKVNVVREVRVQVELPRYAVWIYSLIGILLMGKICPKIWHKVFYSRYSRASPHDIHIFRESIAWVFCRDSACPVNSGFTQGRENYIY
jgi:hypothetical protein